MASGAYDNGVPSPEREVQNPPPNPHTDLYTVKKFADIEIALNKTTLVLQNLSDKIDKQSSSIDKMSDRLHAIDLKMVEIDTKLVRVIDDYKSLDTKLDRVRTTVVGAAAIGTLLILLIPPLIAKIPWGGSTTSVQTEPPKPGRRQ